MIEICHHLIFSAEIIGIGPLMVQSSGDPLTRQIYNTKQMWFLLHLRSHSVKIESDAVSLNEESGKAYLDNYKRMYHQAKKEVISLSTNGKKRSNKQQTA